MKQLFMASEFCENIIILGDLNINLYYETSADVIRWNNLV